MAHRSCHLLGAEEGAEARRKVVAGLGTEKGPVVLWPKTRGCLCRSVRLRVLYHGGGGHGVPRVGRKHQGGTASSTHQPRPRRSS